jgi:hypothetical protein
MSEPRILNFVVSRRGCKEPLDRETLLALEKMAEAAWLEASRKITEAEEKKS